MALRIKKRAPASQTVVDEARREAEKAGLSLERFLQVWCLRGSQGLQADWLRPDERAGPRAAPQPVNRQEALEQRNRAVAQAWASQGASHAGK